VLGLLHDVSRADVRAGNPNRMQPPGLLHPLLVLFRYRHCCSPRPTTSPPSSATISAEPKAPAMTDDFSRTVLSRARNMISSLTENKHRTSQSRGAGSPRTEPS